VQETKIRDLERAVAQAARKASQLEDEYQELFDELEARKAELRRRKRLEREIGRRPELLSALTGAATAQV
jgi:predicted  nucleic acid-binding Zn-ribbon protein